MRARLSVGLFVLGLVLVPTVTRAGAPNPKAGMPAAVIRVQSIDALLETGKYLGTLAGFGEKAEEIEAIVKAMIGEKEGLKGIDTKRPIAIYSNATGDPRDMASVLMVPIADEKYLLETLDDFKLKPEKDKNGVYSLGVGVPGLGQKTIYFLFANNYGYVTDGSAATLAKDKLPDPARLFPGKLTAALSGSFSIDQIPEPARKALLTQLDLKLDEAQQQAPPGETEKQRAFRVQALKEIGGRLASVLKDGKEVDFKLGLNPKAKQFTYEVALKAKPHTPLAEEIAEFGQSKSLFGSLAGGDVAVGGSIHLLLPESLRKSLQPVIDEGIQKALDAETDQGKREYLTRLLRALTPTLKSGELDAAVRLTGPSSKKLYTAVIGVKLAKGDVLGTTLRDLIKELMTLLPEDEQAKVKLDFEKVGSISIHRFDAQDRFPPQVRKEFGDNPVYVAFRKDALFLVLGDNALNTMKQVLAAPAEASRPLQFKLALAQLVELLPLKEQQRKAAQKAFADGERGVVLLSVEGGSALRFRFSADASVLRFVGTTVAAGAKKPANEKQDK
jgi:hypothetical protein